MTQTAKLPAFPMRTIQVSLPDDMLDALDEIGVATNTARAALIREAIGLWISMHEDPLAMIGGILDGIDQITKSAELTGGTEGAA